jgi:hypothetical protein
MNYIDFYNKYANKSTYESDFSGIIQVYRDKEYKLTYMPKYNIVADIWLIPTIHGWGYNIKRKNIFLKDAKKVKLSKNKSTKNEWYKIIDITEIK